MSLRFVLYTFLFLMGIFQHKKTDQNIKSWSEKIWQNIKTWNILNKLSEIKCRIFGGLALQHKKVAPNRDFYVFR